MLEEAHVRLDDQNSPYIVRALGDLPEEALITERALADMFSRCPTSVKRAIERGELPPPVRLFGKSIWTVRALTDHLEARLACAKRKAEEESIRMDALLP